MFFLFKKGYSLLRYLLVLAVAAFTGYQITSGSTIFLVLLGPPIYLAYLVKKLFATLGLIFLFQALPVSTVNNYIFLMPVTLLYFGFIGFQIVQLQKEQGMTRNLSLAALTVFLVFIHYKAWELLTDYFVANP